MELTGKDLCERIAEHNKGNVVFAKVDMDGDVVFTSEAFDFIEEILTGKVQGYENE